MRYQLHFQYCPSCGEKLESRESEFKQRAFCRQCNRIHYQQLKVGAGAIIEDSERRILLLQRTQEPFKSYWNIPAGYAEADEDPVHTVIREVSEETGLKVQVTKLDDVYYFDDDPRGNGILIVYKCKIIGGNLSGSEEGINPSFFSPQELPEKLCGAGHFSAISAWKNKSESV